MNVKTGDMAIVVKSYTGNSVGKIVTVGTMAFPETRYGPVWNIEHAHPVLGMAVNRKSGKLKGIGSFSKQKHCPDAWLKRIDKPSEDARDETLDWLPVPTKETEAA